MLPILLPVLLAAGESQLKLGPGYKAVGGFASPHAVQAAAADGDFVYAVSSTHVAKYDRATGKLLGLSDGPATHMNSAFVHRGKVLCAHSEYPTHPDRNEIKAFDPATRMLTTHHAFKDAPGSLVWNVHDGKNWWVCFAHYGKGTNAKTVLLKMTDDFKELARWTFPKAVVDDWDGMNASGGVWDGDTLLVTHHHFPVLYRLRVPKAGAELEFVGGVRCPFPGQGIARDPAGGGLVGIDRGAKRVVFAAKE